MVALTFSGLFGVGIQKATGPGHTSPPLPHMQSLLKGLSKQNYTVYQADTLVGKPLEFPTQIFIPYSIDEETVFKRLRAMRMSNLGPDVVFTYSSDMRWPEDFNTRFRQVDITV